MSESEQMEQKMEHEEEEEEERGGLQGLPLESSPYVKYSDLEDYKRKAYGTEGHLDPMPHPSVGSDAPTLAGTDISGNQAVTTDEFNPRATP